jgi:hypothetical protein
MMWNATTSWKCNKGCPGSLENREARDGGRHIKGLWEFGVHAIKCESNVGRRITVDASDSAVESILAVFDI